MKSQKTLFEEIDKNLGLNPKQKSKRKSNVRTRNQRKITKMKANLDDNLKLKSLERE